MGVELQAAEEERGLNEAQQATEDEEALQAMREEGMLIDQPDSGVPKPGLTSDTVLHTWHNSRHCLSKPDMTSVTVAQTRVTSDSAS